MKKNLLFVFLSMCAFFYLQSISVQATSLQINPIRLQLEPNGKMTSLELTNNSDESVVIQAKGVKWTHDHGVDTEDATKDILLTPPIATLDPNDTQLIRIGLLKPAHPIKGETYRVIISEIPQPSGQPTSGIKTVFEFKIPLFVEPLTPSKPKIHFTAHRSSKKEIKIKLANAGESHFHLSKITLRESQGSPPLAEEAQFNYVVPTQTKEFPIKIPESYTGSHVHITAHTNQGEISEDVQLSAS